MRQKREEVLVSKKKRSKKLRSWHDRVYLLVLNNLCQKKGGQILHLTDVKKTRKKMCIKKKSGQNLTSQSQETTVSGSPIHDNYT